MILPKKLFAFLAIFILWTFNSIYAQTESEIVYRILDQETKEPVAFATVMLKNLQRGTHADTEGFFEIPKKYVKDYTIVISSIGYATKEIKLANFSEKPINVLYLQPANTTLDEIVIKTNRKKTKRILAYKIVKQAIENIPKNYPTTPYAYIGYYRDYQQPANEEYQKFVNAKTAIDYVNVHEGILEVFDAGFGTNQLLSDNNQTVLYDFKTNTNFRVDTTLTIPYDNRSRKFSKNFTITPLGGNELNILNLVNAIRNYDKMSYSFVDVFKRDFVMNHDFKVKSLQYSGNETLYEIRFKTKKAANSRANYAADGVIYIDKDDFAIHKLHYNLYYKGYRNLQYSITTEYTKRAGKMYLNYITFNNYFINKNSNFFKVDEITLDTKTFSFNLKLNKNVDASTLEPFRKKIKATYNDKFLRIKDIKQIDAKTLKVFLKTDQVHILDARNEPDFVSRFNFEVRNIKDVNGYKINKVVNIKLNQYRELFVQEIFLDKALPKNKTFVNKMLPLSQSKIEDLQLEDSYWINSPLKKAKKE